MIVFLVGLSLQGQREYACEHDRILPEYSWGETRPYPGRSQVAGSIRIGLEYVSTWGYTESDPIGVSLKSGTAQLKGFIQSLLSVTRQQIMTSATMCYTDTTIPAAVRNTYLDYDLYIFANTVSQGGSYANAVGCVLRSTSPRRSIFGRIAWNTQQVTSTATTARGYQLNIRVMFHQFVHVLGFSSGLYQYWVPTTVTSVVSSITYIVTSNVMTEVNAYFGCSSLGMPIENQGGSGSLGSHWEKDALKDELMTAAFYNQDYMYISRLTLALLLDTGWYTSVSFSNAESQYMQFGRGRGCSFLSSRDCSISPEFCTANGLVYYQQSYGSCSSDTFSSCMLQIAYSNTICRNPSYTGIYGGLSITLETPGFKSMAFAASVFALGYTPQAGFRCFESVCNPSGTAITIKVGSRTYTCSANGQTISDSANFAGSVTCPADIVKFCSSIMICENSCDSQYMCVNKQCYASSSSSCTSSQYSSSGACVDCHTSCLTCNSGSSCLTCAPSYNAVTNSLCIQCTVANSVYQPFSQSCVCADGYYGTTTCTGCHASCLTCSSGSSCITCLPGYSPVANSYCIQCGSGASYQTSTQSCDCLSNYYGVSPSCTLCPTSCATCSSGSVCITCATGYNPVSGSLCIQCVGSSFNPMLQICECALKTYGTPPSCINCHASCATCSSGSACTSCNTGYNPVSGSLCIRCPSGSLYNATMQTCVCQSNYFGTPPSCTACHASCATCTSLSACTTCAPNFNRIAGSICILCPANSQYDSTTQTCLCLQGYYPSGSLCVLCVTGCASCSSASNCRSCSPGYTLNGTVCFAQLNCGQNQVISNGACVTCGIKFANKQTQQCVSCGVGQIWGFANNACITCPANLASYLNTCTACPRSLFFYQQTCVTSCPQGMQTDSNMTCQACPATGCNKKITFALRNVTFIGRRLLLKLTVSSTSFLSKMKITSKNFKIRLVKTAKKRQLEQASEINPDSVTISEDGFALAADTPPDMSSGSYSFDVSILDVPSLVSQGETSLSNSQATSQIEVPASAVASSSALSYRIIGFVLGVLLITVGILLKIAGIKYNPVLMSQLIFLWMFVRTTLDLETFYFGFGWSFSNLMYYNPFAVLYNNYTQISIEKVTRITPDHNLVRNAGSTLLSILALGLLLLLCICLIKKRRVHTTKILIATLSNGQTVLLFFSLLSFMLTGQNKQLYSSGHYIAGLVVSGIILFSVVLIPLLNYLFNYQQQQLNQNDSNAQIFQFQQQNTKNQIDSVIEIKTQSPYFRRHSERTQFLIDSVRRALLVLAMSVSLVTVSGLLYAVPVISAINIAATFLCFQLKELPLSLSDLALSIMLVLDMTPSWVLAIPPAATLAYSIALLIHRFVSKQ